MIYSIRRCPERKKKAERGKHDQKKTRTMTVLAGVLLATGVLAAKADSIVYATTGGQMRQTLEREFYKSFAKESGTDVIPYDIEVPDQWARVEAMKRAGKFDFDIVTATGRISSTKPNFC